MHTENELYGDRNQSFSGVLLYIDVCGYNVVLTSGSWCDCGVGG